MKIATWNINSIRLRKENVINFLKNENIDILIDLMGVTSEQRIELLNLRVAPIQILWLGYCNTSGIRNMDYIIADKNLIYEKEKEFYSEKILYLPEIWSAHTGLAIKRKEKIFPHEMHIPLIDRYFFYLSLKGYLFLCF